MNPNLAHVIIAFPSNVGNVPVNVQTNASSIILSNFTLTNCSISTASGCAAGCTGNTIPVFTEASYANTKQPVLNCVVPYADLISQ